jgi:shikimate kinase
MGTGKTTVGRSLAGLMNKDFVDTDSEIEDLLGLKVEEIFARYGEVRFRSEEALVIRRLAKQQNCVISTGGGIVLDPANLNALRTSSHIICLVATPEVIQARVSRRIRPLLRKDRSLKRIQELMEERESCYQGADLYVDSTEVSQDEVVSIICEWYQKQSLIENIEDKIKQ